MATGSGPTSDEWSDVGSDPFCNREDPKALEDHCIALNLESQDLLALPLPRLTTAVHEVLSPRLIQAKAAGF